MTVSAAEPARIIHETTQSDSSNATGSARTMNPSPSVPPTCCRIGAGFDPKRHIVHVPVARFVELDCDHCLRGLEALGVRVDRSKGSSAIDIARNIRATDAISEGFDSVLFIDSDMLFDPADAITLLAVPEPVIAGAYAAKKLGNGQLNVDFEDGVESVRFGDWADRPVSGPGRRCRVPADQDGGTEAHRQGARAALVPDGRAVRLAVLSADGAPRSDGDIYYLGEDYCVHSPLPAGRSDAESRHVVSALPHRRLCLRARRSRRPVPRAVAKHRLPDQAVRTAVSGRGRAALPGLKARMPKPQHLTRRQRWAPYVRQLADMLCLRDWRIDVYEDAAERRKCGRILSAGRRAGSMR